MRPRYFRGAKGDYGGKYELVQGRMIRIVDTPIDSHDVLQSVASPLAGAVVLFLGTTRAVTHGRQTSSLDYECYGEMAAGKLRELADEARRRWPLVGCSLVHRIGHLELGEASVAVAVSSAHRRDAFEAGQWLIDTLKETVPIWKRENWADGTSQWVHPGLGEADAAVFRGEPGGEGERPGEP